MSLKKNFLKGVAWSFFQQFSTQLFSFIVQLVLARILLPSEFGLVAMLTVFIGIGTALFEGGMTSSLIRSTGVDNDDYSTVFIFNIVISFCLYLLLFLIAPYISLFYHQPSLTKIARIYGLSYIFLSFGTVQNTILIKELNFRKQTFINLPALLVGSLIGIYLAYENYGVMAIVYSALVTNFLNSILLWFTSSWNPSFNFNRSKFKFHFTFGYKMTISSVLDSLFTNIYQIVIGKIYNPNLVGYYTRANSLMMLPIGNISSILNKVVFPIFSSVQNDNIKLKEAYKKIMTMVFFIVTPMIVLMFILSDQIFILLFTEKWLPAVPIFKILCFSGLLYPIHLYNLMILQVKGLSGLFLKLEILKKIIIILAITFSLYFGFTGLMISSVITSIISLFINTYYAGKYIEYKVTHQLIDLTPTLLISLIMGVFIYYENLFLESYKIFPSYIISILLGMGLYVTLGIIFKNKSMRDLYLIFKKP